MSCTEPKLEPQPITSEDYEQGIPRKLELAGGYLIDGQEYPEGREALLRLLLVNVGLQLRCSSLRGTSGRKRCKPAEEALCSLT